MTEELALSIEVAREGDPVRQSMLWVLCGKWKELVSRPYVEAISRYRSTEGDVFKDRLTDFGRGSRLAWINAVQVLAGKSVVASTTELPWTTVVRLIRWLDGEHPDHLEWTDEERTQAQADRLAEIWAWIYWHRADVAWWEYLSKERRQDAALERKAA